MSQTDQFICFSSTGSLTQSPRCKRSRSGQLRNIMEYLTWLANSQQEPSLLLVDCSVSSCSSASQLARSNMECFHVRRNLAKPKVANTHFQRSVCWVHLARSDFRNALARSNVARLVFRRTLEKATFRTKVT